VLGSSHVNASLGVANFASIAIAEHQLLKACTISAAYQYQASIWVPKPSDRAALERFNVLEFAVC